MLSLAHADIILVARITWTLVNKRISGPLHAFVSMWHTFHCQGGIQVISAPRDVIWFWKISVQILMDQANPTSWTSKQWRWNREWPWFWAQCEIHKPMTLVPPSICLLFQERNWEIWQIYLSILKAWLEPEFVTTILPSGNPIDMHSITFF